MGYGACNIMVDLELLDPLFYGILCSCELYLEKRYRSVDGFCGVGGVLYFPFESLDLELYDDFFPCWVLFVSY